MEEPNVKNVYLEQVKAEQQQIEVDLKAKRMMAPPAPQAARGMLRMSASPADSYAGIPFQGPSASVGPALDVRITGFWRWKTVIVPPNAYVVTLGVE